MTEEEKKKRIYEEYQEKVRRYISGKVQNPHDAEDLVSCVFVKVYQKLDEFDETKASLSTWIYVITQRTVVDWFRTAKTASELSEAIPAAEDVEHSVFRGELLEALTRALKALPERERDLIILHYYTGYKLKEIAERMDISYTTAKVAHSSALGRLKRALAHYQDCV
ncbi:MAG TPA: RNA polymerase sigma factor [Candidatus Eisenbergiella merdavium]|uniref:RNA polymerase sigma factor n=1 Tax=Candidatus Eisenbergiella merdavium TaxID=2838551 RepID=A0A9D2NHM5_9FIRM|nr:RNA polymerase sigma factor [Candidatus Eisenbergiella merdavium]